LRSGDLDLAVVWREWVPPETESDPLDSSFDQLCLPHDPYRVILPPTHPLRHRRELRLADLASERFIAARPEGYLLPYRTMLERLCAAGGFEPEFGHLVNNITVARALVAAGLGVALLPELALPLPQQDVVVRPVRDTQPYRVLSTIWLRGRQVPSVA